MYLVTHYFLGGQPARTQKKIKYNHMLVRKFIHRVQCCKPELNRTTEPEMNTVQRRFELAVIKGECNQMHCCLINLFTGITTAIDDCCIPSVT